MKLSNKAAEAIGAIRRARKPRVVPVEGGWRCPEPSCNAHNFGRKCGNPTCPTRQHGR